MRISDRQGIVRVEAPAKVNLFLEIIARRQDGYHELETLMATVGIYDTIEFERTDEPSIELACRVHMPAAGPPGRWTAMGSSFPTGNDNLVVRVLDELRRAAGYCGGARVRLHKRIPWQAGLGGGSSDAAAALWAANRAWGLRWSRQKMADFSSHWGSDIPFFFWGGAAVCRGRGERIEPLPHAPRIPLVIAVPQRGLDTARVFRHMNVPSERRSVQPWLEAFGRRSAASAYPSYPRLFNRLESPAMETEPEVAALRRAIESCGTTDARMSGSGSSCFGICRSMRHARRVAGRLGAQGWNPVFATHTVEA